ncbi:MAG: hypothetical protein CL605_09515 [Altibacter sp.]|uniref:hypothetical protein n=1 Tax=Altibacter sp. TaxID=2024823 RepID=UPI000C95C5C1|nr:hypothetical protein [Altibacter sp.]MAP55127.1 hypothetical protein [Altibacter sp.]|tara:strand:+ start:417 stop:770 length:354 start_codon:yes stop_codon:yes gene_type:complete
MEKNLKHHFQDINMNEKHLYILLNVVKNNGDIKRLTREGLSFKDIAELSNQAIKHEFLIYEEHSIAISEKGLKSIKKLDKKFKILDKNKWIEKESKSQISKLDKDFIFLPNQNALDF